MTTVIEVSQANVDNLAHYMMGRELGDEDSDEIPFSVFQSAAASTFERIIDSLCEDPEFLRRHFNTEWDDAFDRALHRPPPPAPEQLTSQSA